MLITFVILLAAIVIAVPLTRRAGLGSVLGYLAAGVVLGPSVLGLVKDPTQIAHVSELGVLMLLFLIGLELRPQRIWTMRRAVFGLGAAQMGLTGLALAGLFLAVGQPMAAALVLGFGFALSSTAIVLPMLAERRLLPSEAGRDGFAVLLFQDIATVPMVALIPLLAAGPAASAGEGAMLLAAGKGLAVVAAIILAGRLVVRHVFRLVARARVPEVFTAAALLVVLAAAEACAAVGLPMSLGAFAAGVLLSDSEYRHELEADVKPFEGLLLGFFFVSVGMQADLSLAMARPVEIGLLVLAVMAVKTAILATLGVLRGQPAGEALRMGAVLQQASEFAFVVFAVGAGASILSPELAKTAILVAALSMLLNPPVFTLVERFVVPRLSRAAARAPDAIETEAAPVILLGFGRFGQVVGRFLKMKGIGVVAVDGNAETIDLVRRFQLKAWFGDPTRHDILESMQAHKARVAVVALSNAEESLRAVDTLRRNFPHLIIVARARDRRHAHQLMDMGVMHIVRETFFSSLRLSEYVLEALGHEPDEAARAVDLFQEHDERVLIDQHKIYQDEASMIRFARETAAELHGILSADAVAARTERN